MSHKTTHKVPITNSLYSLWQINYTFLKTWKKVSSSVSVLQVSLVRNCLNLGLNSKFFQKILGFSTPYLPKKSKSVQFRLMHACSVRTRIGQDREERIIALELV